VCGALHVSLQPLLMSTGWTSGVPVITVTIEIRSSDTDVYSFNSKRMGKEEKRLSKRNYRLEHGRLEQQMTAQYYLLNFFTYVITYLNYLLTLLNYLLT
jgi:hypothetical protein